MRRLVLQVAEATLAPHTHLAEQLADRGIAISTLQREETRLRTCWEEFCDLFNDARHGWPDPDPDPVVVMTPQDLRRMHRAYQQEHRIGAHECFLARQGDR